MDYRVYYGVEVRYFDVTALVAARYLHDRVITLPASESERVEIFGQPRVGIIKHICILAAGKYYYYLSGNLVRHDLDNPSKEGRDQPWEPNRWLMQLQSRLQVHGGSMLQELPEQQLAAAFIKPNATVLEIGSSIGRNTLVIGSIAKRLVTLESDISIVPTLRHNLAINGLTKVAVEPRALSYRKLIQRGHETIPSDTLLEGYQEVATITFQELESKYQLRFDTLVLDCEGAFYWIIRDYPQILANIHTIIVENDYTDYQQKEMVEEAMVAAGLKCVCCRGADWQTTLPCRDCFYEVWQLKN